MKIGKIRGLGKKEARQLLEKRIWMIKAKILSSSFSMDIEQWIPQGAKALFAPKGDGDEVRKRKRIFFFENDDMVRAVANSQGRFEAMRQEIIRKADRICRRQYVVLNESLSFEKEIDWHWDPSKKKKWPKAFFPSIVHADDPEIGDIKTAWELSRHQHLVTLGLAYCLSKKQSYAKEIAHNIDHWIDENRPYLGIHWISGLEIGIRLISWTWCFHLIKETDEVQGCFWGKFMKAVRIQADYIEKNLTIGRYSNNHVVGEAAALAIVGMYFNEWKASHRWVRKGLQILEEEVTKQIHPDGGGVEQATSYLRFIVEFFLQAFLLAELNSLPVQAQVLDRLAKAFEFLMLTMMPDGKATVFGDSDDARALCLGNGEYWNYRGLMALGAVLFERGDFKWVSGGPSRELLWLLGEAGLRRYEKIRAEAPQKMSALLPQSGYAVMRNGWGRNANLMVIDCGSLGYKTGAHGHADALSIQAALGGRQILIDTGTYAYNREQRLRNYFRGTRAHNTVSVDDKDQAEISGRMSWDEIPKAEVIHSYFSDRMDMVTAEEAGYRRLAFPVIHRRTVFFLKKTGLFLVLDKLASEGEHKYDLHYHFPPDMELEMQEDGRSFLAKKENALLYVESSHQALRKMLQGDESPLGWYSNGYGQLTRTSTVEITSRGHGTVLFFSVLMPWMQGDRLTARIAAFEKGGDTEFLVEGKEDKSLLRIHQEISRREFRGVSYKSRAFLLHEAQGEPEYWIYAIDCELLGTGQKPTQWEGSQDVFRILPKAYHC